MGGVSATVLGLVALVGLAGGCRRAPLHGRTGTGLMGGGGVPGGDAGGVGGAGGQGQAGTGGAVDAGFAVRRRRLVQLPGAGHVHLRDESRKVVVQIRA